MTLRTGLPAPYCSYGNVDIPVSVATVPYHTYVVYRSTLPGIILSAHNEEIVRGNRTNCSARRGCALAAHALC